MSALDEIVRATVEAVDGLDDVLLVDGDGMIVASAARRGEAEELIAAAMVDVVKRARQAADEAGLGPPDELVLTHGGGAVVYRAIRGEYGVLAMVGPGGLLGRARFELRRVASRLLPELD